MSNIPKHVDISKLEFDTEEEKEEAVHDALSPRGCHELGADRLNHTDDNASQNSASNAAQPTKDYDNESLDIE